MFKAFIFCFKSMKYLEKHKKVAIILSLFEKK